MKQLESNMTLVFEKLADLKNLFKFGEKIVPIIQSLIEFMKDTIPLLENINTSITESTTKIPQAADKINNVTNATELATTEILDITDEISNLLFEVEPKLSEHFSKYKEKTENYERLKVLLNGNTDALTLLESLAPREYIDSHGEYLQNIIEKIRNNVYSITLSLQVQDITAQQLASVNHLISSVHNKLASLVADIDSADLDEEMIRMKIVSPDKATFDPNAMYKDRTVEQNEIDKMVGDSQSSIASQSDIDKLFGGG